MAEQKSEQKAPKIETANAVEKAAEDTVLAVSRNADGTPRQSPNFGSVDPEATKAISEAQLREQAASAVDYLYRQGKVDESEGSSEPDDEIKALKDAQEKAADAAAKKVEDLG